MKKFIVTLTFLNLFFLFPFSVFGENRTLILATTTSVHDTGLLDRIIPLFEKKTGYFVKTIAVGTGQALKLGKKGETDVLLIHSPDEEIKFIKEGFGINRRTFMYNNFILLGPASNPAKISKDTNIIEAFKKIAQCKSLFISRGDNSGTHIKELSIWQKASINPVGEKWYQETGNGMGQTLLIANEKNGYTLSDRATFLALKKRLNNLKIFGKKDESLKNYYSVIEVNSEKFKKVNKEGAKIFSDFIVNSKEIKEIIKFYGQKEFGEPLFYLIYK